MAVLICRSGLFSILLVFLGALAGFAAPLSDREGMTISKTAHDALSACKGMGVSADSVKLISWQETCRPTLSSNTPSEVDHQIYHPDFVWGDMLFQSQATDDDSLQCLSSAKSGTPELKNYCNVIGMPWNNSIAGIPTISETFQSLYEFDLPGKEFQKYTVSPVEFLDPDREILGYGRTVLSDWSRLHTIPNMASGMPILPIQERSLRNIAFWDPDYQVEVSDTLTRFIPKLSVHTRSLELGDLVALLLFLFLLPDYKKLRSLFFNVWKSDRL